MRRDVIVGFCVFFVLAGAGLIVVGLLQHFVKLARVDHLADYLIAFGALLGLAGLISFVILFTNANRTRANDMP
jgi:hypothetical protein